jgi:phosphatidylglycerophosphate synthase
MFNPRRFVNYLSVSRIGFAMLFVFCFQRNIYLLYFSVLLCGLALVTDLLDGYFARRFHVASTHGRLWDSLGDKSFYVAIIITFNGLGFLGPLVSWALIVRELALYITRVLFIEKLPRIEQIRPWTNWHGYFMYATIVLGLVRMYLEIRGLAAPIHPLMQASAYAALTCGVVSIFSYLKL